VWAKVNPKVDLPHATKATKVAWQEKVTKLQFDPKFFLTLHGFHRPFTSPANWTVENNWPVVPFSWWDNSVYFVDRRLHWKIALI